DSGFEWHLRFTGEMRFQRCCECVPHAACRRSCATVLRIDVAQFAGSDSEIRYRCSCAASRANRPRKRRARCEEDLGKHRARINRQRRVESRRYRRRHPRSFWQNLALAIERRRFRRASVTRQNTISLTKLARSAQTAFESAVHGPIEIAAGRFTCEEESVIDRLSQTFRRLGAAALQVRVRPERERTIPP